MTVDIICAVHNGAPYLDDLFASFQSQTVRDWRCWVRDDGSSDASADAIAAWSAREPRIALLHRGAPALGAAGAFGWLLERLPRDATIVACADHDDVWLPHRLERSIAALRQAESGAPGPVLVHTDLEVVDRELHSLHASFWRAARLHTEPTTVRRLAVDNVVTGSTITMNRALVNILGAHAPPTVVHQDAWFALVAAAFGRIVAVHDVTVRYRQHDTNAVGALQRTARGLGALPGAVSRAIGNRDVYRAHLARSCALAAAFVERFGAQISERDRDFLTEYAALPQQPAFARKLGALTLRQRPGRSVLSALLEFLRA